MPSSPPLVHTNDTFQYVTSTSTSTSSSTVLPTCSSTIDINQSQTDGSRAHEILADSLITTIPNNAELLPNGASNGNGEHVPQYDEIPGMCGVFAAYAYVHTMV